MDSSGQIKFAFFEYSEDDTYWTSRTDDLFSSVTVEDGLARAMTQPRLTLSGLICFQSGPSSFLVKAVEDSMGVHQFLNIHCLCCVWNLQASSLRARINPDANKREYVFTTTVKMHKENSHNGYWGLAEEHSIQSVFNCDNAIRTWDRKLRPGSFFIDLEIKMHKTLSTYGLRAFDMVSSARSKKCPHTAYTTRKPCLPI
jgi:hypothetical protein